MIEFCFGDLWLVVDLHVLITAILVYKQLIEKSSKPQRRKSQKRHKR
jgi:cytochrome c oxidase assembly factor CtaG